MNFDTNIFRLGRLCLKGHDFTGNQQSIRYISSGRCIDCVTNSKPYIKRDKPKIPELLLNTFDPLVFFLGSVCKQGHNFKDSSYSLRYINGGHCMECNKEYRKYYYEANKKEILNKCSEYKKRNYDKYIEFRKAYYLRNREVLLRRCKDYVENNQEKTKLRRKTYYQNNKNQIEEKTKQYKEKNKEKIATWKKEWYEVNKDEISKKRANYRASNVEKERERSKKYRQSPKGKVAKLKNTHKRRALKKENYHVNIGREELENHLALFNDCCAYCESKEFLTIDHFISLSKGGSDCLSNIVLACSKCNSSKGNRDPQKWFESRSFYSKKKWDNILKLLGKYKTDYRQLGLF